MIKYSDHLKLYSPNFPEFPYFFNLFDNEIDWALIERLMVKDPELLKLKTYTFIDIKTLSEILPSFKTLAKLAEYIRQQEQSKKI